MSFGKMKGQRVISRVKRTPCDITLINLIFNRYHWHALTVSIDLPPAALHGTAFNEMDQIK
jgi:hypothetical protein